MLGFEATTEPGCQLRLTAVDLVPMPGKVSVVWHPADPFSLPATTGQALYLAAVQGGLTDVLDLLCSPRRSVDAHSFFRMDR